MALNDTTKSKNKCFVILTDSLFCLMAPKSSFKIPIILQQKIHTTLSRGIIVYFLWIFSHVRIEGNEMADE